MKAGYPRIEVVHPSKSIDACDIILDGHTRIITVEHSTERHVQQAQKIVLVHHFEYNMLDKLILWDFESLYLSHRTNGDSWQRANLMHLSHAIDSNPLI